MPPEPYSFDLVRIFVGDKPLWFLLEVAFRTIFVFAYTLLLLRWMGKRGMGSLTPFEFAIIVALGSAVGDPMFYDDVPLLHIMLVITIVIVMQRVLAWVTMHNSAVERVLESTPRLLVREGVIHTGNLARERFSREELCEALRVEGVRHLGEVEQAYLEPSGKLSVLRRERAVSGLSTLPKITSDGELDDDLGQRPAAGASHCCENCGAGVGEGPVCRACGGTDWTQPVKND